MIFEKVRTDYESNFQPLVLRWCTLWARYPANGVYLAVKVWKPFFALCCELGVYSYYVIFSEGLRNFGFPYLRCITSVSWISSAIAWRNIWCPNEFLWSPNPDNVCMRIFLLYKNNSILHSHPSCLTPFWKMPPSFFPSFSLQGYFSFVFKDCHMYTPHDTYRWPK